MFFELLCHDEAHLFVPKIMAGCLPVTGLLSLSAHGNHTLDLRRYLLAGFAVCLLLNATILPCGGEDLRADERVVSAIHKAATFYRTRVASHGGYVYYYSLDLSQRWGEGLVTSDQAWVQPPGTPTVGMAYLKAYRATGDRYYLEAAQEAASALVYGQLRSGGWSNSMDLKGRGQGHKYSGGDTHREGTSSLDDGQTQSAIQLVMLVDEALDFKNTEIHRSAVMALDALLAAQFPNGGFPQGWKTPVSKQPVLKASYPDYDWKTEGRIKNYWDMYTLNDNVCGYVADALILANRIYKDDKHQAALNLLGDFLILAQMPDPQPAWAQQYNYAMQPIWARKFEPPGVSGDESQEVIETLMRIYVTTGNRKLLEPIPHAIAYLKRSLLPDGRLARYYQLKTNTPLYMVRSGKKYELTTDDSNLPEHYGWKTESRLGELEKEYNALNMGQRPVSGTDGGLESQVLRIIRDLDDQGRWISTYAGEPLVGQPKFKLNSQYISSAVFSQNIATLSDHLTSHRKD